MCIFHTRRLMLGRRAGSHSTGSTSNHIAWTGNNFYFALLLHTLGILALGHVDEQSASIVPHIPLFAGCNQSLQRRLEIPRGKNLASLPCVPKNGLPVSWMLSFCTTWSLPAVAPVSFELLVALSGKVQSSEDDQGHGAIPSISLAIALGERPARWAYIWYHMWDHIWYHIWNHMLLIHEIICDITCDVVCY